MMLQFDTRHTMGKTTRMRRIMTTAAMALFSVSAGVRPSPTDQEVLAISMIAESGFKSTIDQKAVAWVYRRRADDRGWPLRKMVMAYSRGTWYGNRDRAQWLRGITERCTVPRGWKLGASWWNRYKKGPCLEAMDRAYRFISQPSSVPDPCDGKSMHFGSDEDKPDPSLIRVDCGPTLNRFYRIKKSKKNEQ